MLIASLSHLRYELSPFVWITSWLSDSYRAKVRDCFIFELIDKHNVTIAPIAPPVILAMAKSPDLDKYDLSSIRTVMSGGAPLGKELENTMRLKFPHAKLGQVFMIFPCFI